jgi:hypothetical protein
MLTNRCCRSAPKAVATAWLHSCCWEAWHNAPKAEAIAGLAAMGIGADEMVTRTETQQIAVYR